MMAHLEVEEAPRLDDVAPMAAYMKPENNGTPNNLVYAGSG
jgi:hypothetical protein